MDLKSMTTKELEKLLADVTKALETSQQRDLKAARKAAVKAAAEFGFSLADLEDVTEAPKKRRKARAKGPKTKSVAQFANPADASQTWTGKGRQPNWFREAIAKGASPDDLRI